ncbi:cytochrome-c peroxidase [Pseudahrensia aquimaris]|uniref:Cytochrome-c peroxidase n=1 Tax=Pseudahrensia aquimaris TaxID=744461 RepID=A0ABW3FNG8_9HYPH
MNATLCILTGCLALIASASTPSAQTLPMPVSEQEYRPVEPAKARLGQMLFYDRVLSGTYRVSCATCHNHDRGSSNGYRLDGAPEMTFDEMATNGVSPWAPFAPSSRHAPALFNLGAYEFDTLFSDGRVQLKDGQLIVPPEAKLPDGVTDVLAAQSLFPTITSDELTGTQGSDLAQSNHSAIWDALVARVADLPDYTPFFNAAFDDVAASQDIRIDHIANALGAFVASEWRSDNAPFDRYLRGDATALSMQQQRGMKLFYGEAGCNVCHSGSFQTDHGFHAAFLTAPQHKSEAEKGDRPRWLGRMNVTGDAKDLMKVRTPSLRNVARTAPYGLAGQYETLEELMRVHAGGFDAVKIGSYRPADSDTEMDIRVRRVERASLEEQKDLIAFLESLTDEAGLAGRLGKPEAVPSSLAID